MDKDRGLDGIVEGRPSTAEAYKVWQARAIEVYDEIRFASGIRSLVPGNWRRLDRYEAHSAWVPVAQKGDNKVAARIVTTHKQSGGIEKAGIEFAVVSAEPRDGYTEDYVDIHGEAVYVDESRRLTEDRAAATELDGNQMWRHASIDSMHTSLDMIENALNTTLMEADAAGA